MMADFTKALRKMRDGETWQREPWSIHQYIRVYEDEALLIHAGKGWGTWKPKQEDLLARDWVEWKPLVDPQQKMSFNERREAFTPVPMPDSLREKLLGAIPAEDNGE